MQKLLRNRYRISFQLYAGIGGAVLLTVAASLVGWFSFNQVGDAQRRINDGTIPEIAAAFGVARYSGTLVDAGPRLTAAATREEFDSISSSIAQTRNDFNEQLTVLEETSGEYGGLPEIRAFAKDLTDNIHEINADKAKLLELDQRSEEMREELAKLRSDLDRIVGPAIDDQLFYTMTGYGTLGEWPSSRAKHFSEEEFGRYRNLAEIQADGNIAIQLLSNAFNLSDASSIEPLRERFEAANGRIERSLAGLEGTHLRSEVTPLYDALYKLGMDPGSGFALLAQQKRLAQHMRELLDRNRQIADELRGEVNILVAAAQSSAQQATASSEQAILTGRTLLLAISAVSIGGALLIAYLFVGRVILRRVGMLSNGMQRMAGGDLETEVDVGGRDEIADMAAALEVFRRHALEVQRLNLVERLAGELQEKNDQLESVNNRLESQAEELQNANGQLESANDRLESQAQELQDKNDELESVLGDLRRAQDQIVMREKLAALGELTAGVAHEIRNPLNFVKNFSEASDDLLDELRETLDEAADRLNQEQKDLVADISGDLSDNMGRIKFHGERANRIVQDMLMMGRGTGGQQPTDLNRLLEQNARLAFHSARALDADFQMAINEDMDPDIGEIEVVPQDIGRVFLNMVANACDATAEKRAAEETEPDYEPSLLLTTKRLDEDVEIRIRDNGNGIPPDVVDKIFNPFFTTKPTDRGTGLGLAICTDIVRKHGGGIRVESQPGEFTEMIIQLPTNPIILGDDETAGEPAGAAADS